MSIQLSVVVVWYNPTLQEVSNINTYIKDVEKIYIIDNSGENNLSLLLNINYAEKIKYIPNFRNLGIAAALNIACDSAVSDGFDWCMTLDQDSRFESDNLKRFLDIANVLALESRIGILAPSINEQEYLPNNNITRVITSGNILNLKAYYSVGKFDESLFIDEVDHEFCYRMIECGYKIKKIQEVVLNHSVGTLRITKKLLWLNVDVMNHSATRKYYIFRNRLIVKRRYPKYCKDYSRNNVKLFLAVLFFEENKINKIKMLLKAYIDYIFKTKGELK